MNLKRFRVYFLFLFGVYDVCKAESSAGMVYFNRLLQRLRLKYFFECTEIYFIFGVENSGFYLEDINDFFQRRSTTQSDPEPSLWQVFTINNQTMKQIEMYDINLLSKCPVYISLAKNVSEMVEFFRPTNKSWDKYFYSRKHVIYTESSLSEIESFLSLDHMQSFINLVLCTFDSKISSLRILSNKPYDKTASIQFLDTFDGKHLKKIDRIFWDKLSNFNQYKMQVATFNFPPRIFMAKIPDSEEYEVKGLDIWLLQTIAAVLNISLEFDIPSDGNLWGWETDNGSWTGLIGDLQRRKVDIGVADLFVMEPYFKACELSVEYDIEYLCFANAVPGPLPQSYALMLPFTLETWSLFLLFAALGMFSLAALSSVRRYIGIPESHWFDRSSNNVLLIYTCVVNTSWVREPYSTHMRILTIFSSLGFFILGFAYKGSLVSHLSVPRNQAPIDTHEQLYKAGIDVGTVGTTFKRIMEKNADPWVRKLVERYHDISSMDDGFERAVTGSFSLLEGRGFLEFTIATKYTTSYGKRTLHVMREYIAPFGIAVAYPKYVPYIAKFNEVIRKVTEAGLPIQWLKTLSISEGGRIGTGSASSDEATSVKPLTLKNMQSSFFVLFAGYILAATAFLVEMICKCARKEIKNY